MLRAFRIFHSCKHKAITVIDTDEYDTDYRVFERVVALQDMPCFECVKYKLKVWEVPVPENMETEIPTGD